jgi:hypothetical protein
VPRDEYSAVVFLENGKKVKTIEIGEK